MSNTPLPGSAKCLKWLFIIFNIIFVVFGLALIGVGAWLIAYDSRFKFIFNNGVVGGAALIIVCGGITFVIAGIGVAGALCQSRPLLVIFAVCLTVIIVLEIVGAILGFVFRDFVSQQFTDILGRAIQEYTTDPALQAIINETQTGFKCCGVNGYSDWNTSSFFAMNMEFPQSCCSSTTVTCNATEPTLFRTGCVTAASNIGYAIALGAVGLVVGLLEIAGIILSLLLCICIHKSKLTEV